MVNVRSKGRKRAAGDLLLADRKNKRNERDDEKDKQLKEMVENMTKVRKQMSKKSNVAVIYRALELIEDANTKAILKNNYLIWH